MNDDQSNADSQRMTSQFIWIVGGRISAAGLQALLLILFARSSSISDFGSVMAGFGALTFVLSLGELGMATLIVRERARGLHPELVIGALRVNRTSASVMSVIICITLLFSEYLSGNYIFFFLIPLGLGLVLERVADTRLSIPIADGNTWIVSINLIIRRLLAACTFLALTSLGYQPALCFGLAYLVSGVVAVVAVVLFRTKQGQDGSVYVSASLIIRKGFPYWANTMGTQLRNLDTLLVSSVTGVGQVANYAAGTRLVGPIQLLVTSAATVLMPHSARIKVSERRGMIRKITVISCGATVFYVGIASTTFIWLPLIFGDSFFDAVLTVSIFMMGLAPASFIELGKPILQGWGYGIMVAKTSAAGSLLLLVAVLVGALLWGGAGAAIGYGFAMLVQAVTIGLLLKFRSEG